IGVRVPVVVDADRCVDSPGGGDRVGAHRVHLAHHCDAGALLRGGQRRPLASEAGADDQDVVCWHSSGIGFGDGMGAALYNGGTCEPWLAAGLIRTAYVAGRSACLTCASVTTPCRTSSLSTATMAPRRPRPSAPSSDSSGASSLIRTGMSSSRTSTTGRAGRPAAISLSTRWRRTTPRKWRAGSTTANHGQR